MVDWNRAQIIGHLLKVVTKSSSLCSTWDNVTLLRNKHFWTMKIPPDSSWIWKKVLKLCNIALQFITYDIGNGCNTSLRFDPWWEGVCLVSTLTSPIICQCGLSSNATIGVLLQTSHWALPTPNSRHPHVDPPLTQCLGHFSFLIVHVHREDRILWAGIYTVKIKTWNIWNSIRNRGTEIRWAPAI
ncbi:uncharacterized protein LOC141666348 [Apium graveolens]|uniref:uncharacterized protein LOC141666348 n=1 Tax=Apium graveolens TaxID=4045 RepID=UPI003D78E461